MLAPDFLLRVQTQMISVFFKNEESAIWNTNNNPGSSLLVFFEKPSFPYPHNKMNDAFSVWI